MDDRTRHVTHDPARPAAHGRMRAFALIGAPDGERSMTHTTGYPIDPAQLLPEADVVVLVADDDGPGAMLFRYSAWGEVAGDTWHPTVADAHEAAAAEYGMALHAWEEIPAEVADPHAFAARVALDRLDGRDG
jgi:hypothetical protein